MQQELVQKSSERSEPSLAALLLRPFIDLEPCERGALYSVGVEHYWAALADRDRPKFYLQRTLPSLFRSRLLAEIGRQEYQVEDPRDLRLELRSARWQALCEALDQWSDLAPDARCRLVLVLHALCFYSLIQRRVPDIPAAEIVDDSDLAELAYWRASARYVLARPDRIGEYVDADLSEFERIAAIAARDRPVTLNAALKILVHKAKTGAPAEDLVEYRARAERILVDVMAKADYFTSAILQSRFYRAAAFVPQSKNDRAEMIRTMDLAEQHALSAAPADAAQELIYRENLHPLLESRTKEACWLGDLDLALERALKVIDLDPYDSKAWLELGQVRLGRPEYAPAAEAYASAAVLGPPASAIAQHMAGICFRNLGQPSLAALFFKSAIELDERAFSPHDEIQTLPQLPIFTALKEWSLNCFQS
jgi:tetratricopeptide (TPR) repeat protein